jgi:ribosomal protein S27E
MSNEQNVAVISQQKMDEPKAPVGLYELPCGLLLQSGALHTEVQVREISGDEEDLLANDKIGGEKKVAELLARCVTRVGPFEGTQARACVLDLTVGDRTFLLFAIRRVSLGDEYPFVDKCPACENEQLFNLSLAELEVKKMEKPTVRKFNITLPSGIVAGWHVMTGHDEAFVQKFIKEGSDKVSLAIMARLDTLNGEEVSRIPLKGKPTALAAVKALGMRDRNHLRDAFQEMEGGVETTMDMECPGCGHEYRSDLDVGQQGFFFPSAAQKAWRKKSST